MTTIDMPVTTTRDRLPYLDPEPFRKWLRKKLERHDQKELAALTRMNEKRIRAYLEGERKRSGEVEPIRIISLHMVDRALTYYDGDEQLFDLYPELFRD